MTSEYRRGDIIRKHRDLVEEMHCRIRISMEADENVTELKLIP